MNRRLVERLARWLLCGLLLIAFASWFAAHYVAPDFKALLRNIVVVALLIAVPLGFVVAWRPREIQPTADTELDEAIDQVLAEESRRRKTRSESH